MDRGSRHRRDIWRSGTTQDRLRFQDPVSPLELAAGTPPDQVPGRIRMAAFADFAQYPQFGATIAGNAARIVAALGKQ